MNRVINVGRRKTAVARVFINAAKTPGKGTFSVNKRTMAEFFPVDILQMKVEEPFKLLQVSISDYDVLVNVKGGGINGQAEAVRMGISRNMVEMNPEIKPVLRKAGLLTRDSRMVERKKYGQPKARKRFQFSKR
jgi:small subunit ribosomal protein S9